MSRLIKSLITLKPRNRLTENTLSQLMRIAIESPENLTDTIVEEILDVWYRKPRKNIYLKLFSLLA